MDLQDVFCPFQKRPGGSSRWRRFECLSERCLQTTASGEIGGWAGPDGDRLPLPTCTSKWNPIEHRLFSEISKTWAGCPLRSFDLVLDYINDTKTQTGLTVQAHLITTPYPIGVKVSDELMQTLNIQEHDICPPWNYTIRPRPGSLA